MYSAACASRWGFKCYCGMSWNFCLMSQGDHSPPFSVRLFLLVNFWLARRLPMMSLRQFCQKTISDNGSIRQSVVVINTYAYVTLNFNTYQTERTWAMAIILNVSSAFNMPVSTVGSHSKEVLVLLRCLQQYCNITADNRSLKTFPFFPPPTPSPQNHHNNILI